MFSRLGPLVSGSRSLVCGVVIAAGVAGCAGSAGNSDGEQRNIVALEYSNERSRTEIANTVKRVAESCWKQDARFAGLRFAGMTPRMEPESFMITLRPDKTDKTSREIDIVVVGSPRGASGFTGPGYAVQLRQRGGGPDVRDAVRNAIKGSC